MTVLVIPGRIFGTFGGKSTAKPPKAHKLAIHGIQEHSAFIPLKQYVLSDSLFCFSTSVKQKYYFFQVNGLAKAREYNKIE